MKIVKVIRVGSIRFPLTDRDLRVYRKGFLKEAESLAAQVRETTCSLEEGLIVFDRMLSPFQYWLENRFEVYVELNKNPNGTMKNREGWEGKP